MDADGVENDFAGDFGTYSDTATFAFALTFTRGIETTSLQSAIEWTIDTSVTGVTGNNIAFDPTTDYTTTGTDFIYTFYYAVQGLYGANGTYSIGFNDSIEDDADNTIAADTLNTALSSISDTLCSSGTCQFDNDPVTLLAATFNPSTAVVLSNSDSAPQDLQVTLTFSQPVSFNGSTSAIDDDFDLQFVTLNDNELASTTNLDTTLQSTTPNTVSDSTDNIHYTEHVLTIRDTTSAYWAQSNYFNNVSESSLLKLFFENITTQANGVTYIESFQTATAAFITLPTTIQDGDASSSTATSTTQFSVITQIPALTSATPVAATNSDNTQGDGTSKRHVQFTFSDFNPDFGDAIGMHLLFRTTDDAFVISEDTAPYYGAEGGIALTGNDLEGSNSSSTGYHICPPFSKHLDRVGTGMQSERAFTYNANRLKIHYLVIPYDPTSGAHLYDAAALTADPSTYQNITVDFNDNLPNTEPCVRTAFYNEGEGQYGYIVDTDQEEQHMVIANAMLQDAHGDQQDLAMLPKEQLNSVYFDLYSKDYYNDSWRKDLTITAQDLLGQLTEAKLNDDLILHDTSSNITFQVDSDYLSIFASRFVNTINARFLDSVFLDDFTLSDVPAHNIDWKDKHDQILTHPVYDNLTDKTNASYTYLRAEDDYFTPNYRNQTPDNLVAANDNRIVLSIGVHPSAIQVDAGSGTYFQPFESNQANFLKMDPAFYGLYYGGTANTTEPAFDYTSRHLAYVNFDLVYELQIDDKTQEITGATLVQIVSPFTLLRYSFFSQSELQARQTNGETYSAVAASIADNVFRHNFTGTESSSTVQHFLPYGVYCRTSTSSPSDSSCYNSQAQMLLPNPSDTDNHARTIASPHHLHRGVLYLENTTAYSTNADSDNDSLGNGGPSLLQRFMRINDGYSGSYDTSVSATSNPYTPGRIGSYSYSTMLYNSFDRDHAYNYTYSTNSENYAYKIDRDGIYSTASANDSDGYEQQYWGVSPYAESPDARADQILPNAFFMGGQIGDYHFEFTNQPYQYTSFVQQVNANLADPDYLANKNTFLRGLSLGVTQDGNDYSWSGSGSFNIYPSFAMLDSENIEHTTTISISPSAGNPSSHFSNRSAPYAYYPNRPELAHIFSLDPHNYVYKNYYRTKEDEDSSSYPLRYSRVPSLYHSGRTPGFLPGIETTTGTYGIYERVSSGSFSEDFNNLLYRGDLGFRPKGSGNNYQYFNSSNQDGRWYAGTVDSDFYYEAGGSAGGNIQRMVLPHHEDDYDFDRGQIMANKLGFFVDNGHSMDLDYTLNSNLDYGFVHSRLFFPSNPAVSIAGVTTKGDVDYVVTRRANEGKVTNYYPLVQANEALHTSTGTWPVLLTTYKATSNSYYVYNSKDDRAAYVSGVDGSFGAASQDHMHFNLGSEYYKSTVQLPIDLDKIFPEGYRYQLGFVNREELFMYDATVGNGDTSSDPIISRLYESAVGHFGYATQFSRLNRRAMKKYHLGTSSQFLGDHLARFESEPSLGAGAHSPSDLDSVFDHTPANQGGTGTNYGSYRDGHYNLSTSTTSQLSGNWRHRTYQGTLRGYVLEMRTNPVEDNYFHESAYEVSPSDYPKDGSGDYTETFDLRGTHPDGNP